MTSFGSCRRSWSKLPAEPEVGGILMALCARDVRVERRFPADADVSALYDFVRARHDTPNRFRLMSVPRAEVARPENHVGPTYDRPTHFSPTSVKSDLF